MSDTLIILEDGGSPAVAAVAACSEKSRNKSLEQGELWVVDRETGRVLPFRGGGVRHGTFAQRDGWWEVTVPGRADGAERVDTPGVASVSPTGARAEADTGLRAPAAGTSPPLSPTEVGTVLTDLGAVIAERRRTMPEGSYTTHLFTKGPAKIRKKTGEEAVEVILATSADELRSEAADLLYHLLVLLEVEGLSVEEVVAELDRRHRKG